MAFASPSSLHTARNALVLAVWLFALFIVALIDPAAANEYVDNPPPLIDRLTPEVLAVVWPGAVSLETVEGPPPAVAVLDEAGEVEGYIFSTLDVIHARGFVPTPFDAIAGVRADGTITGATQVFNRDTFVYRDAERTALLAIYLSSFTGLAYNQLTAAPRAPDFVDGTTITARAMRGAITDSARIVMRGLFGAPVVTEPTLDREVYLPRTMDELWADGSIRSIALTNGDIAAALEAAGATGYDLDTNLAADPDELYIDFRFALATPPTVTQNILGSRTLIDRIASEYPEGTNTILFGSNGRYNFQGVKFQNASSGYRLERVDVTQGDNTFEFFRDTFIRAGSSGLGAYTGIVAIAPDSGFDPLQPFSVNLHVLATAPDGAVTTLTFPTAYQVPPQYVLLPEPEPEPLWVSTWRDATPQLIVLGIALTVLTLIFIFQARLAQYRRLHRWVRNGFLLFTLVWIGYIAGAQFSIIHVINYLKAPFEGLDLGFYLLEPLIFVLAIYIVVSLILIGRGVFCGWLCPFGALQELSHKVGRFLRLPEWNPSPRVQQWMWLPKYGIVFFIVATAFLAPEISAVAAEVEPFKTAITSTFGRPWFYVAYAGALLVIGLFSERFFCRFLCPLGATFALLDRLHLIDLLKRRPECGSPCHLCERSCPVRAIKPTGEIVTAECFQCLDCQVEYHDDRRCPPLAKERKVRERATTRPAPPLGQPVPAFARTVEA
ncbi:MAG: 4Fe-4S binding protein [Bauldia sp.]|nr:4Fe-4S binding protein [Bauldia sp.]